MEASVRKAEVIDSSKKTRSLDLTGISDKRSRSSIGNSRAGKQNGLKRKNGLHFEREGSNFAESGNKRSRKEVLLSGSDPAFKKHENGRSTPKTKGLASRVRKRKYARSLAGALHNLSGPSESLHDPDCLLALSPPSTKEDDQTSSVGNLESLDGLDCSLAVPKWSQVVSGRKRSEKSTSTNRARGASVSRGKSSSNGQTRKLAAKSVSPSRASTIKLHGKRFDEFKENGSSRNSKGYRNKGADATSVKDRRKRGSTKPQFSAVETQIHKESEPPSPGDSQKSSEYFLDEDEESLEENAAIMLSSRFDPRCTGFPGKRTKSSQPVNEPSLQLFSEISKTPVLDLSLLHAKNRALRPRKNNGSFVRKRRHFYEVRYSDMDPWWVVKQRIRVFWPLDQNWYFGLVKDYDPVRKLHYVKYEDREEEWLNLQNERFKLLLFPSEVKFNPEELKSRSKTKNEEGDSSIVDDNCMGTITESETIISWLARSNRPVKPSLNAIQKERSIPLPEEFETSSKVSSKLSSTLTERLIEAQITPLPKTERIAESSNRKLSFVYSRKRFHRRKGIIHKDGGDTSCPRLSGPITFLASVADRESGFQEIKLKLSLPPLGIDHHAFGAGRFLLSRFLLIHYGKLMRLWPKVHMEMVFVDSAMGLRWLSFEGCLRWAVELVCLIIATFYQNRKQNRLSEIQVPYTSIGFELSGLHDRRRHFLFALCSFVELNSKNWRYLENKLKLQCMTIGKLPIGECTYVNTKTLSSRSKRNQVLCTSIFEYPTIPEFPSKRSSSDIMHQLVNKSASLSMDTGLCYFDKECRMLRPSVLPFAPAPLFFLSVHLNLLMENIAAPLRFQEPNLTSSRGSPENDKSTREGCSPVADSSDQFSEISNENLGPAGASYGDWGRSSHNFLNRDEGKEASDETFVHSQRSLCHTRAQRGAKKSSLPFHQDSGYSSSQLFTQASEKLSERKQRASYGEPDLLWGMNDHIARSPKTTAPRSTWHHSRHSSKLWPEDFIRNDFCNGSKKPRTQVSYSSHVGNSDPGSKNRSHHRRERIYKKTKSDCFDSSTCSANVLVTFGDRGWRERGAQIVLNSHDQKNWRLSVKFSGTTKYTHSVHQFLLPGTTNRYTYAMMWKGGKDWTLEFTDRTQWSLFKVMYEECLNRNIKAASVKNIPIPGVHLIDDGDENVIESPFIRNSSKYHRQVGSEVEMALDPWHVMYDMDDIDEEWISNLKDALDAEVSDDMFERVMDMFEKIAYAEQCDRFTCDKMEEVMAGFGPLDITKAIYEHWRGKRRKKGLPLVRQFQPPLWKHYQKQLKEWEFSMSKIHGSPDGCQRKSSLPEKPPMFAFCLRPRGLEVTNKGSKQKSHRKFMFVGPPSPFPRELDGSHSHGPKSNGLTAGDEFSCSSHLALASLNDSDRRNISRRNGMPFSPSVTQISPFRQRERSKRSRVLSWGTDVSEWPGRTKHPQPDQLPRHQADTNEFRLRDASSAARYTANVAKHKRAKAQWLLHKADLARHKAEAAIMTAELIKSMQEDLSGESEDERYHM